MTPIRDRWQEYASMLPASLAGAPLEALEWAFFTGAAAAFQELRALRDPIQGLWLRHVMQLELEQFAAAVEREGVLRL